MSSWSPTLEPPLPSSRDSFGCDPRDDADSNSSNSGVSSAPVSLADDASASSSLFPHQRQDLANGLVGQLCRYLDSRVAEAQLMKPMSSWHTHNGPSEQWGEQSQTATHQERVLRVDESGEAGGSAAARNHGCRPPALGPEGEEGNRDGDRDDRRRKRPRLSSSSFGETKRLACPYYKRNPSKYCKWTSCPGPGWDEIHRVKFVVPHISTSQG